MPLPRSQPEPATESSAAAALEPSLNPRASRCCLLEAAPATEPLLPRGRVRALAAPRFTVCHVLMRPRRKSSDSDSESLRQQRNGAEGEEAAYIVVCRMHFGEENKAVAARTDGRPARAAPALVTRKGVTYLEEERDHPRVVQAPLRLARGWCANYDFQPVIAAQVDVAALDDSAHGKANEP